MSRSRSLAILAGAAISAAFLGTAVAPPASAAVAVAPNGSFTFSFPGPNTTNTSGNITSTTTSLMVAGSQAIGSFMDPYLGAPDNFCSAAGNGCSAAHPPGFLVGGGGGVGSAVTNSLMTFPVGPVGSTFAVSDIVTATQGAANVDLDYTSEQVTVLSATTASAAGSVTLEFTGTFASNNTGVYTLGQSADMSLACTQPANFGAISCSASVDSPALVPAPLIGHGLPVALAVGGMLFGARLMERSRRRRSPGAAIPDAA